MDYVFPWVQLLQDFKFHSQDDLARPLAQLMADAVRSSFSPAPAESSRAAALPDLLLPVPLSADRLRERGYNQAWELARQLGRLLDRPARSGVLQRVQQGPAQAGLSRAQRQRNLLGAFCVTPSGAASLQGRHVALVDDVMTTGATVREATQTLLQAGAARVDVWVLARTPTPTA